MKKLMMRILLALCALTLLALAWWGWTHSGLSLLQLGSFIC